MAALGMMNHLALTLSDLKTSEKVFYQPVLEFLGYRKLEDGEEMTLWWSERVGAAVNLWQADPELASVPHQRYAPGFHHFAFSAESREQVDRLHDRLREIGAKVLDPPADYPYMPGYYAVFFADPDGLKFEFVYIPQTRPLVE
jgi:catechol 2,3-dioxygenase-like lactoylglutathione lyase family enzyme